MHPHHDVDGDAILLARTSSGLSEKILAKVCLASLCKTLVARLQGQVLHEVPSIALLWSAQAFSRTVHSAKVRQFRLFHVQTTCSSALWQTYMQVSLQRWGPAALPNFVLQCGSATYYF